MNRWVTYCFLFITSCTVMRLSANAQSPACQPNIGFENGSFQNWQCYTGKIERNGSLQIGAAAPPVTNVHTIVPRSAGNTLDPYGHFPIAPPNGSAYSIKLGNTDVNAEAERISYTFTIPPGQNTYSIIYSYAVVLENPNHTEMEQPRFRAEIIDMTNGAAVNCGSFDYTATLDIPGFEVSTVNPGVFYKPWSSVTVNLNGYAGKTIRIVFTGNDCSQGGHFGYAYVDVSENCSSHIGGNRYCPGMNAITLTGPAGFESYTWYTANFGTILGRAPNLTLSPPPPNNTVVALVIKPLTGVGCPDTLYTTISAVNDPFQLEVKDSLQACLDPGANLTSATITTGSSPGLSFDYFEDGAMLKPVPDPTRITQSGTYYIRGRNSIGCATTKPIYVSVVSPNALKVHTPFHGCRGQLADLTLPSLTTGTDPGLLYSYWMDSLATLPVTTPASVDAGTYFIRATSALGCFTTKRIVVGMADLQVTDIIACGAADLTQGSVTAGSSGALEYSYWLDAAATVPALSASSITSNGTYFIKGTANSGCSMQQAIQVTVNPLPTLTVTTPLPVELPQTINLAQLAHTDAGSTLYFWKNAAATEALRTPLQVAESGTYYVQAERAGCTVILPVTVKLLPPPPPVVTAPNAFSPNGDGVNDLFYITLEGKTEPRYLRIFNRHGMEVFATRDIARAWDGKSGGKALPIGVYYWVLETFDPYRRKLWNFNGSITLLR